MKLDFDCVRDILSTLEQQDDFVQMLPQELAALLPKYSQKQINYTCWRLYEGNYIHLFPYRSPYSYSDSDMKIRLIGDLTFKGHEFLANIKAPNNYKRIKEALKKIGGASLEAIFPVAASIVAEEIKKSMGL